MTQNGTRNKEATQQRILAVAAHILATQGLEALGVNTLAKAANCDKKLIYRYFGGMDGVMAAIGDDVAQRFAMTLQDDVGQDTLGWRAFELALLNGLLAAYRTDPLLAQLRAAEIAGPLGGFAPFAQARGAYLAQWMARHRPRSAPPQDIDIPAFNAVIIGAVEAAVICAMQANSFAGLPLETAQDWNRYHEMLQKIVITQFKD